MSRHRHRPIAAAVLAMTAATTVSACGGAAVTDTSTASSGPVPTHRAAHASPISPTGTSTSAERVHRTSATSKADRRIAKLTGDLGRRGVSIAAVDTSDGVTFDYGAQHGMLCASIAKLDILETLLLQHQQSGHPLGDSTTELATEMIENSDNDAANDLYTDIGEGAGLSRSAAALGVRNTTPGSGIYWGFTRTGAGGYLALLRDLIHPGALDTASRHLALQLLSHVEADQRWGVGSVATSGTTFYNKNGWLAVSTDGGRWAVNSVGIVTVHGHRLLMVIMTQHGPGFESGVDLVDRLARITAAAVLTH